MKVGRALIATLVVASIGAACGSSDEDADAADAAGDSSESAESPEPVSSQPAPVTAAQSGDDGAAADPGTGDAEFGDNGGLAFTFSGGYDVSGNYVWVPVASVFTSGWWAMSFTPPNSESAAVFSLLLDPANTNFSFGDGEVTIFGFAPQCSFNIDHQDSSGASGSLNCTGITAITAAGEVSDVNLSATFDATH